MSVAALNSNLASLNAQRRLGESTSGLTRAFERLSSGLRINRASDDAAGLAIATALGVDERVFMQAIRNLNDAVGYLAVAGGAAEQLSAILARLKELSAQSANGVYSDAQRRPLEGELQAVAAEYNRIVMTTSFNGKQLFLAEEAALTVQAGYGESGSLRISLTAGMKALPYGSEIASAAVSSTGAQAASSVVSVLQSVSADGRYVVFESGAANLVPGDTNSATDIFLHDRQTGTTTRVSVDSSGNQTDGGFSATISADGRFVAFYAQSSDIVPGDTGGWIDAFVHDTQTGTTTRVSVDSTGAQGNNDSWDPSEERGPSISADGRYVAFESYASNLVAGDTNGSRDIFVFDRQTGETTRVSVDSTGMEADSNSWHPTISDDGRYVSFVSFGSNLVAGDTNGTRDVFVHDRQSGQTTRVSVDSSGAQSNGPSDTASISSDGRYVVFESSAGNLVAGDANGARDIFMYDRQTGATRKVSIDISGTGTNGDSHYPSISADGRYVAYYSYASNLAAGDTNGEGDVFVYDTLLNITARVSTDSSGVEGDDLSFYPSISADGRHVIFSSYATNLIAGDGNGAYEAFVAPNPLAAAYSISLVSGLSIDTQEAALTTLTALDGYFQEVTGLQGSIGSAQSRYETALANLQSTVENIETARSRIIDADFAHEAAQLTKERILQQSGVAVLSRANQLPALALTLLQAA